MLGPMSRGTPHAAVEGASGSFLRLLAAACAATGVPFTEALRDAGIAPASVEELEPRIPLTQARQAWVAAARRFGGDDFGLAAADRLPVGSFNLVEFAARACATWGQALDRVARFGHLMNEGTEFALETSGSLALFTHRARGALRPVSELMMAYLLLRGRAITGLEWKPRSVSFMHREPAATDAHARVFQAPVRFGEPRDALIFDRALLDHPLLTAEPSLAGVLERHAEALLTRLPNQATMELAVRRAMQAMLPAGEPRIDRVAKTLAMTPRTLQRRLREEGTAFQKVLDDLRRELAAAYLHDQGKPAGEVAFLLGFADPSAFRRAFKRWNGASPGKRAPPRG